jgi:hypothetical protein
VRRYVCMSANVANELSLDLAEQVLSAALHPTGHRSSVTEFDAGGNNLWGPSVGVSFADALLAPSCSLVALDLQGCAIGDAGAAALTSALRAGCGLAFLGVGWNQIGTAASTALVEALHSPACGLTRLGHWRNNLCEAGGRAVAAVLGEPAYLSAPPPCKIDAIMFI